MDLVMISPVSPFAPIDGHRLAVLSDVHACLDSQIRMGLLCFTYDQEPAPTIKPLCEYAELRARSGGFKTRLARSVFSSLPPSAERFYSRNLSGQIRAHLLRWKPKLVLFNDASVAGYAPLVRELLPNSKIILRSHNVMHDVRLEQANRTSGVLRPLVEWDCSRYIQLEKTAVLACDDHWAISTTDARRMQSLYGKPAKVLSVSIDTKQYQNTVTEKEGASTFVHIGTVDYRRRNDVIAFLKTHWPRVLKTDRNAELIFAGKLHGETPCEQNVSFVGAVNSDSEIYSRGRFALNLQTSTGGIKIKTLTALAARKTLISSVAGVEGLSLKPGVHYADLRETFKSPENIRCLLNDRDLSESLAREGFSYVEQNHARSTIAQNFISNLNTAWVNNTVGVNAEELSHAKTSRVVTACT